MAQHGSSNEWQRPYAQNGRGGNAGFEGGPSGVARGSSPTRHELAQLDIVMPTLYEERASKSEKGKKRDLMPKVLPEFSFGGEQLALRKETDYFLVVYEGGDPEAALTPDLRVDELTDEGVYRAVISGVSEQAQGQVVVPFAVRKRRRRIWPWALLAALLVAVGIFLALLFTGNTPWYDPNAGQGLAGIHDDDLQKYLDEQVEAGMMNITVLEKCIFEGYGTMDPDHPGEVGFNNIPGNHVDQKLTITLDDTGEVVYESGAISPGQSIQYITLNRELDPGAYSATATVTGYDRESHEKAGALAVAIRVIVTE